MKGLKYLDPKQMSKISGLKALYRLPYLIDSTKDYQNISINLALFFLASSSPILLFPF
jgi:hypothetical protein